MTTKAIETAIKDYGEYYTFIIGLCLGFLFGCSLTLLIKLNSQ